MFELIAASGVIIVILTQTPLCDPGHNRDAIGSPFEPPNSELRSPEDNLTLWQFMSVSWLSPLIKLGSQRQLHEEDIWNLGFEFQHSHLHQKFRELEGSVTNRLIAANTIDLVIMSVMAVFESLASMRFTREFLLIALHEADQCDRLCHSCSPATDSSEYGRTLLISDRCRDLRYCVTDR